MLSKAVSVFFLKILFLQKEVIYQKNLAISSILPQSLRFVVQSLHCAVTLKWFEIQKHFVAVLTPNQVIVHILFFNLFKYLIQPRSKYRQLLQYSFEQVSFSIFLFLQHYLSIWELKKIGKCTSLHCILILFVIVRCNCLNQKVFFCQKIVFVAFQRKRG